MSKQRTVLVEAKNIQTHLMVHCLDFCLSAVALCLVKERSATDPLFQAEPCVPEQDALWETSPHPTPTQPWQRYSEHSLERTHTQESKQNHDTNMQCTAVWI